MANTKNYMEQGGDKLVIGGELAIETNGSVSGLPVATSTVVGGVKAAAKTDSETNECKIGSDGKLYAAGGTVSTATAQSYGLVKSASMPQLSESAELSDVISAWNNLRTAFMNTGIAYDSTAR